MMRKMRNKNKPGTIPLLLALGAIILLSAATNVHAARIEMTDQAVADAIEDEYMLDEAINHNMIDVEAAGGIVTLTGTVDNVLAKERAAYIAEQVRGVRSISNRIAVHPLPTRSDTDLKKAVQDALLVNPATESYQVDVSVKDGVVTLTGTVDSYGDKQLSARVAKQVRGVIDLKNELDVEYKVERPDAEIEPEIEERLRWDVLVDDGLIDVSVDNGAVTLSGTVGSLAEKRQARWNAWVPGVVSVDDSNLSVEEWAAEDELRRDKYRSKLDSEIQKAIESAALYDPRVLSANITADVDNGWVTLRGNVQSIQAKRAAEDLAKHTVGVTEVTNRLKVRPAYTPSDEEIAENVRRALQENPYTDQADIDVSVDNGTITLFGDVGSAFEKAEAEKLAAGVRGATRVKNYLAVAGEQPPEDHTVTYHYPWYRPVITVPDEENMTDAQILDKIESELWWSPFVDSDQVDVTVENEVATLRGTVDSWREYYAAADNAYEGGAEVVRNYVEVE